MDASHVYVRALAQGCFQSYQYPNLSESADRVAGQLRGDKECPFSGVTKSGRVWRKVSEAMLGVCSCSKLQALVYKSRGNFFLFFSLFFTRGGCVSCLRVCLGRYVFTVLSVPKPFGARWPRRWTAARRQRVPLQWRNQL